MGILVQLEAGTGRVSKQSVSWWFPPWGRGHPMATLLWNRPKWCPVANAAALMVKIQICHIGHWLLLIWKIISYSRNVFSRICVLLTVFLGVEQFCLLISGFKADKEYKSPGKLLMSMLSGSEDCERFKNYTVRSSWQETASSGRWTERSVSLSVQHR